MPVVPSGAVHVTVAEARSRGRTCSGADRASAVTIATVDIRVAVSTRDRWSPVVNPVSAATRAIPHPRSAAAPSSLATTASTRSVARRGTRPHEADARRLRNGAGHCSRVPGGGNSSDSWSSSSHRTR